MNIYIPIEWAFKIPCWGWMLIGYGVVWTIAFFLPRRSWKWVREFEEPTDGAAGILILFALLLWWVAIPFVALCWVVWLFYRLWLIVHREEPHVPYKPRR